jgi:uncharacterized protein DUF4388
MPIEGTLREFGIHDVFQLLDLSRKTGMLRVRSQLRNDEGRVYFDGGRVVHASLRSKPITRDGQGLSARDVERKLRSQIETTVYDLMSWREGLFSFEERAIADIPPDARVKIPTESLLMEGARRIDEWSRIAGKVPNVGVVPVLAESASEHESQLDLLPHEWEVLTMIDGQRDLQAIASALSRGEFDIAKIVYGLVTTGVVEIRQVRRVTLPPQPAVNPLVSQSLEAGYAAVQAGHFAEARQHWERFLEIAPNDPSASRVRSALDALTTLQTSIESHRHG